MDKLGYHAFELREWLCQMTLDQTEHDVLALVKIKPLNMEWSRRVAENVAAL